jgi:hypothetical protein
MSVNILVDTIFVGQWIGSLCGCNGGSTDNVPDFIVRYGYRYGADLFFLGPWCKDPEKTKLTFANQIMMTFFLASLFCSTRHFFSADMLLFLVQRTIITNWQNSPQSLFPFLSGTLCDGKQYYKDGRQAKSTWS